MPVLGRDIEHFSLWSGLYRMLKQCLLHDRKIALKCRILNINVLHMSLIFREFVVKGDSVRKYSLIFRGRVENSDKIITEYWKYESALYSFHFSRRELGLYGIKIVVFYRSQIQLNFSLSLFVENYHINQYMYVNDIHVLNNYIFLS